MLFYENAYEKQGLTNPATDYEEIYHLYHSFASFETDLSFEIPKPEPLIERFNRTELMEKLSTPLSYSSRYQALRCVCFLKALSTLKT